MTTFPDLRPPLRSWPAFWAGLAVFVGVGRGAEPAPISFPSGEMVLGYAGSKSCTSVNVAQDKLTVWNLADGKPRLVIRGDFQSQGLEGVAFSKNRAAFLVADDRIVVYSLEVGSRVVELAPEDESISAVAISPDGRSLAYTYSDGRQPQCKLVSLPEGDAVAIIPGAGRHPDCSAGLRSCLTFSSDGRLLATSAAEVVSTTEAHTGRAVQLLKGHRNQVETAAFSGDGKRLATVSCDGRLFVWDLASGKSLAEFHWPVVGSQGANGKAELSYDGARALWAGWGTTRVWSVADRKLLKELPGFWQGKAGAFRFTPDAKRLIEYGPELLMWDLEKPSDKPLQSLGKGLWFHLDPTCRWIGHRPPDDDDAPQKLVPVDFSADPQAQERK